MISPVVTETTPRPEAVTPDPFIAVPAAATPAATASPAPAFRRPPGSRS
jgi:hypothetical protein